PIRRSPTVFEAVLPPLPEGNYAFYGDVTHENGFSQTITTTASIPPPASSNRAEDPSLVSDPDDSWHQNRDKVRSRSAPGKAARVLGDGLTMQWDQSALLTAGRETSLRFFVLDGNGRRPKLEPYMGMMSHAVLRHDDGSVFAHLHPAGSISVASQQVF